GFPFTRWYPNLSFAIILLVISQLSPPLSRFITISKSSLYMWSSSSESKYISSILSLSFSTSKALSFVIQVIDESEYFFLSEGKIEVVLKTSPTASSLIIIIFLNSSGFSVKSGGPIGGNSSVIVSSFSYKVQSLQNTP